MMNVFFTFIFPLEHDYWRILKKILKVEFLAEYKNRFLKFLFKNRFLKLLFKNHFLKLLFKNWFLAFLVKS